MIPKIIHYCWFGHNPLPSDARKCIASWEKFCPDYKIIEWNENNYDVHKNTYMSDAYKAKKWAFVSDYARIDVVYEFGGVYMDTDVELIKSLDSVLDTGLYGGWENRDAVMDKMNMKYENSVSFGLGFGAVKGHSVLKELLDLYDKLSFYNADGSMNLVACPYYQTLILKKIGLDDSERSLQKFNGITIYPETFFSPKSQVTGQITLTDQTISIHHFSMTWQNKENVFFRQLEWKLTTKLGFKWAYRLVRLISLPYRAKDKIKKYLFSNRLQNKKRYI